MNMKKSFKRVSWRKKGYLCMLPGLMGVLVFSVIPFFRVLYYSMLDNQFRRSFVFLDNYIKVMENKYFRLALKNSILFILRTVPVMIALSVVIAVFIHSFLKEKKWILTAFMLPVVTPSAGITVLWKKIFASVDNTIPVDLLFIWKNLGLCVLLISAALYMMPEDMYDAAYIDGAGNLKIHIFITIPVISPAILFTNLIAVINSFRIFRESYLYYGTGYPPEYAYTLQYYMNNHFLKLDYQKLAAASVYAAVICAVVIAAGFVLIRRHEI